MSSLNSKDILLYIVHLYWYKEICTSFFLSVRNFKFNFVSLLQIGAYKYNSGYPIELNHTLSLSGTILKINDALNKIYKEQVSSNLLLQRVLSKIEGIEANSLTISKKFVHLDSNFLNLFPINSTISFMQNKNRIRDDSDFILKLALWKHETYMFRTLLFLWLCKKKYTNATRPLL
jgi:hypothetical protein